MNKCNPLKCKVFQHGMAKMVQLSKMLEGCFSTSVYATDILSPISFNACVCVSVSVSVCIGGCPLHCGLFSSTRDLYPLRCQQYPPQLVKTKKYFQTPPDLPLIKNHCSRGNVVHHNLDSDSLKILKWLFTQRGTYCKKHHH